MSFPAFPLAAIHAVCADPITYTGPGLALGPITGIYSNESADPLYGSGKTARIVSFEIQRADLPRRPEKADLIEHRSGAWSVVDITDRDDVAAWIVKVEKTA